MPLYIFQHPKTGEVVEVIQNCNESHVFCRDKVKWDRVWTIPTAGIDTNIDPFNKQKFVDKTYQSKTSVGEMWDRSKELSEKRKQKLGLGFDPVKEKYKKEHPTTRDR